MNPDNWHLEQLQRDILEGATEYVRGRLRDHGVDRFEISLTISTETGVSTTRDSYVEDSCLSQDEVPSDLGQQGAFVLFSVPDGEDFA